MHRRLKELREGAGLSQTSLAKKLGISQSALGYYERGERLADSSVLSKLADYFNTSTDYLLGRSDARKPENEDIAKRLGLTEKAIDLLAGKYKVDRENDFTRVTNMLIEEETLLRLLYFYFYHTVEIKGDSTTSLIFFTKSIYGTPGLHTLESKEDANYLEASEMLHMLDTEMFKEWALLRIQEHLAELLKKVSEKEHSTD